MYSDVLEFKLTVNERIFLTPSIYVSLHILIIIIHGHDDIYVYYPHDGLHSILQVQYLSKSQLDYSNRELQGCCIFVCQNPEIS